MDDTSPAPGQFRQAVIVDSVTGTRYTVMEMDPGPRGDRELRGYVLRNSAAYRRRTGHGLQVSHIVPAAGS